MGWDKGLLFLSPLNASTSTFHGNVFGGGGEKSFRECQEQIREFVRLRVRNCCLKIAFHFYDFYIARGWSF